LVVSEPAVRNAGAERPVSGAVGAVGVEIHIHPEDRQGLEPAATALIGALNEIGIAAKDAGFNAFKVRTEAQFIS
jgi:hypothetical protein